MVKVTLKEWMPLYFELARELGLDVAEDRRATLVLSTLLHTRPSPLALLKRLLAGRRVMVFGAGPSLEEALNHLDLEEARRSFTFIAANGSTSALLERGALPHIICTDLDGRVEDQVKSNIEGSLTVIHAHGDNINSLTRYTLSFTGPVVGSTQVEPAYHVYNFGGFTDGDRCVFLASWGGAAEIVLVGMDLGVKVGRYSKPWLKEEVEAWGLKAAKLRIAKRLLEWLASREDKARLYIVGGSLKGFTSLSLKQLRRLV